MEQLESCTVRDTRIIKIHVHVCSLKRVEFINIALKSNDENISSICDQGEHLYIYSEKPRVS